MTSELSFVDVCNRLWTDGKERDRKMPLLRRAVCALRNHLEDGLKRPEMYKVNIDDAHAESSLVYLRKHPKTERYKFGCGSFTTADSRVILVAWVATRRWRCAEKATADRCVPLPVTQEPPSVHGFSSRNGSGRPPRSHDSKCSTAPRSVVQPIGIAPSSAVPKEPHPINLRCSGQSPRVGTNFRRFGMRPHR